MCRLHLYSKRVFGAIELAEMIVIPHSINTIAIDQVTATLRCIHAVRDITCTTHHTPSSSLLVMAREAWARHLTRVTSPSLGM